MSGWPTLSYALLSLATWAGHALLAAYVLAGSAWVAAGALRGRPPGPVAMVLKDGLPFALGLAITAGVAPLLFLQILYRHPFYSANLLGGPRFMAMLPALIAGFYLLYLQKSPLIQRTGGRARAAVAVGSFLCFAFVAWTWTENHLLALSPAAWVPMYVAEERFFLPPELWLRLGLWLAGAFPPMLALVIIQLRLQASPLEVRRAAARQAAAAGLIALAPAALLGAIYLRAVGPAPAQLLSGAPALASLACAMGVLLAAAGFLQVRRGGLLGPAPALALAGCGLLILGTGGLREISRAARLEVGRYAAEHAQAWESGGLWLFLGCLALNGLLIAGCARLAWKAHQRGAGPGAG